MLKLFANRVAVFVSISLCIWISTAQARDFQYRYISFDRRLPAEVAFFDAKVINAGGWVYGDAYTCVAVDCNEIVPHIAVYVGGKIKILQPDQPSYVYAANDRGLIGGSVLIDTVNFVEQAALFHGNTVELIPPLPGELYSAVTKVNNAGMAVVLSFDDVRGSYFAYRHGATRPLDFGPDITPSRITGLNDWGILSGTQGSPPTGFRFNTWSGAAKLLYPVPTEPYAWGLGINNRGDVVGYSFVNNGRERIGVWDRQGVFKTYFVEGVPEFPTVSNSLRINDNNWIVITSVSSPAAERFKNSYLVPEPGVRLNIADLVTNLPPETNLSFIIDINNRGDMIGSDIFGGSFLLKRTGWWTNESPSSAAEELRSPADAIRDTRPAQYRALAASVMNRKLTALKADTALKAAVR